jgi:hypothetical protein
MWRNFRFTRLGKTVSHAAPPAHYICHSAIFAVAEWLRFPAGQRRQCRAMRATTRYGA